LDLLTCGNTARRQRPGAPGGRWKERAMFLIVLVAIVAVIMIAAVPRIRRKR
jgi:hypothetical protein